MLARRHLGGMVVLAVLATGPASSAEDGNLPRERSMFGPLVCGNVVLAGTQDRSSADGKCHARLFCFDLADGRKRWQREYAASDMLEDLLSGPAGTALLTMYHGGALVIRLADGRVTRHLTSKPEAAWKQVVANKTTLFCDGSVKTSAGGVYPTISAYDARTLKRLWWHRLPDPRWIIGELRADEERVEVPVLLPMSPGASCVGAPGPASAMAAGVFGYQARTGTALGRSEAGTLSSGRSCVMVLPNGREVMYGGGNASYSAFYQQASDYGTRRIRWRLSFEGMHDSILAPPFMLVAYGHSGYTDALATHRIVFTRALIAIDAATGKTVWQAALEPGKITPPQVLRPDDPPPRVEPPPLPRPDPLIALWNRLRYSSRMQRSAGVAAVALVLLSVALLRRGRRSHN